MNFKSTKRSIIDNSPNKKLKTEAKSPEPSRPQVRTVVSNTNFYDLNHICLGAVARFLDTKTCLNILRTCTEIYDKLYRSSGFWKHLCHNENFHEYTALK